VSADSVSSALEAYRAEHSGARVRASLVRRRVLAGLSQKRERRARLVRFAVPIAATFFASAALAATDAGRTRVQEIFNRVELLFSSSERAPVPPTQPLRKRDAANEVMPPAAPALLRDRVAVETPAPVVSLDQLPLAPVGLEPSGSRPGEAARNAVPRRASSASPDLAAYGRAHALHFHGSNPTAALAAWDAYLAQFPTGMFVPEARINRAVALARTGKRRDAERALDSIAADETDDYGRTRANSLREALGDRYRL
jgi:hypothetical protein